MSIFRNDKTIDLPDSWWMVDIETLSLNVYDPCIVEIGVCLYDGGKFTTKSVTIKPDTSTIDLETLEWWANQPNFVNLLSKLNSEGYTSVSVALDMVIDKVLTSHLKNNDNELHESFLLEDRSWYFNPPGFDATSLERAANPLAIPWKWYQVKCFRTLREIHGDYREDAAIEMDMSSNRHNAGYDAELQSRALRMIFQSIKK